MEDEKNQKSVLFISPQPFFAWRGSPIRVAFDVMALAKLGYEVDLLTLPIGEPREIPGVNVRRVPAIPGVKNIPIGPSFGKLLYDGLLFCVGLGMVFRKKYTIIHGIEEAAFVAILLAGIRGSSVVYEKHSDPGSHRSKGGLRNVVMTAYAAVERSMVRGADAVIGTGRTLVQQALKVCPTKPVHHVFDLPSSLVEPDDTRAAAVRAKLQQKPDEVLALYVGSFAVYQGIDLLFEATVKACRQHPRLRLIVIGGSEAERAERGAWLAGQGCADRVTFAGFVAPDTLPDYLRAVDVLLSPRISGVNSPLKMLDYLKAGRAIVATDLPANRELVDDTNALLVPANAEAFAAGMVKLAGDETLRNQLAAAGRKLIDETYNFPEFCRRLDACYAALRR